MPNSLRIAAICASETTVVVFPTIMAFSHAPRASFINSASHFVSCFIRKWSNEDMKENNSYNLYDKAEVGVTAGIVKYGLKDGFTKKSAVLGGLNNLAYHMAPEIYAKFFNGTDAKAYEFALPIVIEATENILSLCLFGAADSVIDDNAIGEAVMDGIIIGSLLDFFGTIESKMTTAVIDYAADSTNYVTALTSGTIEIVHDEL